MIALALSRVRTSLLILEQFNMLLSFLLSLLPSFLHVWIRRNLLGQEVSQSCKLGFLSILNCKKLKIGNDVRIGPFVAISANTLSIGSKSSIGSLNRIITHTFEIGHYSGIGKLNYISGDFTEKAIFRMGDHSKVFDFCYFECAYGIFIGNNVGAGGHTLIFTHGYWGDFLIGRPRSTGAVKIEDDVWIAWRVFIPPGITIKKGSLISANSIVTRTVKENTLVAVESAKLVSELITYDISEENDFQKIHKRAITVCKEFIRQYGEMPSPSQAEISVFQISNKINLVLVKEEADIQAIGMNTIVFSLISITSLTVQPIAVFDYTSKTITYYQPEQILSVFKSHLSSYGLRFYEKYYQA
jgi:acetyltransferase-like isoleucine patch superfamily enzyme